MPRRPLVQRGDWFQGRGPMSRVVLRYYLLPPSQGLPAYTDTRIEPWQYLGPVHEVEETAVFTSILVPHFGEGPDLRWVNAWRSGVDFAYKVEIWPWILLGWRNRFLD